MDVDYICRRRDTLEQGRSSERVEFLQRGFMCCAVLCWRICISAGHLFCEGLYYQGVLWVAAPEPIGRE
jgi:hypothetical protein